MAMETVTPINGELRVVLAALSWLLRAGEQMVAENSVPQGGHDDDAAPPDFDPTAKAVGLAARFAAEAILATLPALPRHSLLRKTADAPPDPSWSLADLHGDAARVVAGAIHGHKLAEPDAVILGGGDPRWQVLTALYGRLS